ncbi:2-hydroxyacid dehydrogenase [Paraburkholderia susongensis]|uniref:Gluconate 2-dehydrogenase n=1 Tax=Paraburkholderia susongensis TaxID=1515439 RepID=A0A1X7L515_9BURK|nr:D-glycerate dehydrogenase [Paraburkholderia susongensis]SMG48948.1 gluconate 2-dehydrogenase [Paraburkholderia susongensis]
MKHVVAYRSLPPAVLGLLREHCSVELTDVSSGDLAPFKRALGTAHGMVGNNLKITPGILDAAPLLQVASTISAGFDAFDVPELSRRGIVLTNTPEEVTETTADLVFSLILASARRIAELADWTRRGQWTRTIGEAQFGVDVHHKTLGIVGLGRIGSAVAKRAALGFGMDVIYSNRSRNPEAEERYGAQWRPLAELLATADFVCVLVPLSPATERLIGSAELAAMKPSAILINCARGQVVDEAALIAHLREGRILGAGLDVFEREPVPPDSPLLQLPNVVAVPHIGSATRQTRENMAMRAVRNLIDALDGRLSSTCVNPEALHARSPAQQIAG